MTREQLHAKYDDSVILAGEDKKIIMEAITKGKTIDLVQTEKLMDSVLFLQSELGIISFAYETAKQELALLRTKLILAIKFRESTDEESKTTFADEQRKIDEAISNQINKAQQNENNQSGPEEGQNSSTEGEQSSDEIFETESVTVDVIESEDSYGTSEASDVQSASA